MADRASSGLSKAAKKNLKRRAAKQRALALGAAKQKEDVVTPEELKEVLTREMETAKEKNDHETMKSLREQIWVINDMIAGVKTDLPDDELKNILDKLPISDTLKKKKQLAQAAVQNGEAGEAKENDKSPEAQAPGAKASKKGRAEKAKAKENQPPESAANGESNGLKMPIEEAEKKLKNLRKKLKDIGKLKAKISNGEKLEKNQMEKVKQEKKLIEEIDDLELDINTGKLNR